jgi:xylulokinase
MDHLVGLDVGTTNTKAIALDPTTGRIIAVTSQPTPYVEVGNGAREIDPEQLWLAVVSCLNELGERAGGAVLAIGIASMAEAGIPLDAADRPLYRLIPWYDPRTEPQLRNTVARVGAEHLFEVTGMATRHVYSLFKLLWLREHEPSAYRRLRRWLCVSDYVAWRLTGEAATDLSLAARTMLFDQRSGAWSAELLGLVDLTAAQLPRVAPSGTTIGRITAAAAAETGLTVGAAVGIGGHDHLCGALASGVVEPGGVADSLGTAESLVIPVATYHGDDRLRRGRMCCYPYVAPGRFVVQAGMAMSGGGLDWLAHRLFSEAGDPVAAALAAASDVPIGSHGLFYFPYLGGNGSPIGDENVTASFIGLRPTHERGHLVRALLEGIAYGIRDSLQVATEIAQLPEGPIVAFGGGSRSATWLQIRADVIGRPIVAGEVPEAVAVGAALLAGTGAGIFADTADAVARIDRPSVLYEPRSAERDWYDEAYHAVYREIYPALQPVFARMSELAAARLPDATR